MAQAPCYVDTLPQGTPKSETLTAFLRVQVDACDAARYPGAVFVLARARPCARAHAVAVQHVCAPCLMLLTANHDYRVQPCWVQTLACATTKLDMTLYADVLQCFQK